MPVLGCGAEMAKLMDVADSDVALIEDVIAERLALGVSQAVAQRQAVDEALAQLADERSMVMKAVMEQLGVKEADPVMSNKPAFREDIPNESWLQGKVDYAQRSPRNEFGVPKMSSVTGYFDNRVMFPARWASELKGQRGEQDNVRKDDLAAIRKILKDTGKMPLTDDGKEYVPYIEIGYNGKPWVSEGNHRIMAAVAEGWDYIPAEVRYFDGGQRRAGKWAPDNLIEITERESGETPVFSNKKSALGFYSALSDEVGKINAKAQPADGWKAQIKGLVAKGAIKADEVEWTGINDWLDLQQGKVTKEAVMGHLDGNGVQVRETSLGAGVSEGYLDILLADNTQFTEEEIGQLSYEEKADIARNDGLLDGDETPPKYSQYTLPGGENYREVLLTLPEKNEGEVPAGWSLIDVADEDRRDGMDVPDGEVGPWKFKGPGISSRSYKTRDEALAALRREVGDSPTGRYRSSHWDAPNVLAHIRVNDRTDATGARVLFVEEIQSDWGQEGKKRGFKQSVDRDAIESRMQSITARLREIAKSGVDESPELQAEWNSLSDEKSQLTEQLVRSNNGTPVAPFVTKTEGWLNLALKRIITMAVDGGYDKVAFVNGEQSADRYDLSKQIKAITAKRYENSGTYSLGIDLLGGGMMPKSGVTESELPDLVGKEMAQKIIDGTADGKRAHFTGLDLKVGGEGMKTFYDSIVPKAVNELLRKLKTGAKLGEVDIGRLKGDGDSQYSMGAIDPAKAKIVERAPGVFQVWAENDRGVKQVRGGNFDTREQAERYIKDMAPGQTQPGFDVTDAMREKVEQGMPLFSNKKAGAATPAPATKKPSGLRWRDDTGRLQFAPGEWLYRKSADGWAGTALRLIGMKSMSPELKRQMRQMTHKVEQAKETAAAVARETIKLSQAEREMVSDLVEKTVKAGTVPPAHAVKLAALVNQTMEQQTNKLVALGMLSQDAADRWRGVYLPRYYAPKLRSLTNVDQWADALKNLTRRASLMRGIKGRGLKSRGMFENIHPADLPNYQALGWEVRDPEYKPGISTEVQVWRDYTPQERENMGEIRDAGFRFIMGYMQTQKDIAMGEMFQRMADDDTISSRLPTKANTVLVPDTKVADTGVKVYGALAGRYVSKETLSHLTSFEETQSDMLRMYRKGMSLWKEGKTVLNPVSHLNNTISNMTMAHLGGVGYHRGDKYIGALSDFITGEGYIQEGKEAGLFQGNFTEAELAESLPPELRELARMQEGLGVKISRTAFNVMTLWLRKPMTAAYQFEDSFFKYLIYKDARKRGLDPQDAIDYAQRYIFTYDDLPKGARNVRDFGMPFFAYTYKAVPALLHTALTHPLRMAMPAGLLWAATAATYASLAGEDDEDWMEKLKRAALDAERRKKIGDMIDFDQDHLPPWMRGYTAFMTPKVMRVGFDQTLDMPVFLDVSRLIPGGDLFDINANAGGVPLPQPLTPGHPLLGIAMSMIGNRDLFSGKDIVDKNDTSGEAAEKRLAWMWKAVTPAIVFGNYHWDRALDMMANASGGELTYAPEIISERYTGVGRDGLPVQVKYGLPQTFGVKVRPIDQDKAEEIEGAIDNKRIREIDAEIRQLQRLNDVGFLSNKRADAMIELQEVKKERLKDGLTVDGNEKD